MTKAEEFAINTYPRDIYTGTKGDSIRAACALGYYAGERGELTWKDMKRIVLVQQELMEELGVDGWNERGAEACFEEVLKRFTNENTLD